jgi:hypothetical protein
MELEADPTASSTPPPPAVVDELARLREAAALREAALAFGVKPAAVVDFLRRVREERPTQESRVDPTGPPSLEEYVERLREDAPHLFEPRPPRPRGH